MPLGLGRVALMRGGTAAPAELALGNVAHQVFAGVTGWSWNHVLQADDDLILVLGGYQRSEDAFSAAYGGVAATLVRHQSQTNRRASGYVVKASSLPATGTRAATMTFGTAGTSSATGRGLCVALQGAAQTDPVHNGASSTTSSLGATAVTLQPGGVAFQIVTVNGDKVSSLERGAGETLIFMGLAEQATTINTHLASYKFHTGGAPASISMSASWTGDANAAHTIVGVNPA